jgi:hypothetical protein
MRMFVKIFFFKRKVYHHTSYIIMIYFSISATIAFYRIKYTFLTLRSLRLPFSVLQKPFSYHGLALIVHYKGHIPQKSNFQNDNCVILSSHKIHIILSKDKSVVSSYIVYYDLVAFKNCISF